MGVSKTVIDSGDGAEITALIYAPESNASDFSFICLPAMGVKASYYNPVAERLVRKGHIVVLCDLRGQGTSNQNPASIMFGYKESLELDLPAIINQIKQKFPDKRRIFLGHSLGGQLGLLHASVNPKAVDAIAIIASGSVYYKAYKFPHNLKVLLATQSSILISAFFGYFPGHKIGFGGKQPKTVMRDWAYQARTGNYNPKGSELDYGMAMQKLKMPIFACSIERDNFAPHSATDHLVSKLINANITRCKYEPSAHLKDKIDHFKWVKNNEEIIDIVCNWVDQNFD